MLALGGLLIYVEGQRVIAPERRGLALLADVMRIVFGFALLFPPLAVVQQLSRVVGTSRPPSVGLTTSAVAALSASLALNSVIWIVGSRRQT